MPFYFDHDADLQGNQLLNAVLEKEADGAGLTLEGQIGYNTTSDKMQYRNATVVLELASLTGTETLTNKTLTSPVIDTGVTGTAVRTDAGGGIRAYASASDSLLATEKAIRAAIDAVVGATNAMVFKGGIDCSANPNYPAADCGDTYTVTVAGKIGGASGVTVEAGDTMICTTDSTAAGDHATVGANWVVVQANLDIVPTSKGGTGANLSITQWDLLVGDTGNKLARLAKGTDGYVLTMVSGAVAWAATQTPVDTFLELTDTPSSFGTAGALVQVNGTANALVFTTATFPATAAQGDILFATGANVWGVLAKSTTAKSFLSNKGTSNAPQWSVIQTADLPTGVNHIYVAAFESAGTPVTTLTVTAATHGCGTTPFAWLMKLVGSNYEPVACSIQVATATGDVTATVKVACKGKLIIMG
jgi:hypothetical protein